MTQKKKNSIIIVFIFISIWIMFFYYLQSGRNSKEAQIKNKIYMKKFKESYFKGRLIDAKNSGRAIHLILEIDSMNIVSNCCFPDIIQDRMNKKLLEISVSREAVKLIKKGYTIFKNYNSSTIKYYDNGKIKTLY